MITARLRPNPVLTAVPGYNINPASGLSPWFPSVTLDYPIETAGKRGYRQAQARHLSDAARWSIAAVAWQLRSNLRASLLDYVSAQRREILFAQSKELQGQVVDLLEQQVRAGATSRSELTLIRIASDQLQLELNDARLQKVDARVRIADAIGVATTALEGLEFDYDLRDTFAGADVLFTPDIRRQALESRVDILGALSEYAARQSALQLEIAKQYPDIHLGPGYQFDQGAHKLSLSVSVELPIFNRNQGPIAEAEARRAEAAARFNVLQAKVMNEIDRAIAACRVAQVNTSTVESLVAGRQARSEAVTAQLRAGASDRIELLNSQIELGASQLLQLTGRIRLAQAFGALEDAIQRPLYPSQVSWVERSPRSEPIQENHP